MSFTLEITGWASQVQGNQLPICKISSATEIKNAGFDFDAYSGESIDVHPLAGQYIASFIFWSEARVHAVIDDIHLHMVNLDDKVGIFLYSKTTGFTVNSKSAVNNKGIWYGFAVIEDSEKIQVKAGDKS